MASNLEAMASVTALLSIRPFSTPEQKPVIAEIVQNISVNGQQTMIEMTCKQTLRNFKIKSQLQELQSTCRMSGSVAVHTTWVELRPYAKTPKANLKVPNLKVNNLSFCRVASNILLLALGKWTS